MYSKQIYAYGNIRYVEIPPVGRSTRMHRVYQNLDNIYYEKKSCCIWRF